MANKQIVEQKSEAVDKLVKDMQGAKSYILCEFAGLTVMQMESLRKELRKSDCVLKVATNNTIKRASAKEGFNELTDTEGPSCVVISKSESVDGPRIVATFAKKNKQLVMKDGVVDGEYYNADGILAISKLPSRLTLLTMLAGGLIQPLQQLALGLKLVAEAKEQPAVAVQEEAKAPEAPEAPAAQ